jgi:hypothetical protein
VVHQRGHLRERGLHPPGLLPAAVRAAPGNPDAYHPGPLRHVDRRRVLHDLRALLLYLLAVTAVPGHASVFRLAVLRGHRRLAFLVNQQDEAARGAARERSNLIGVLESDSTQPA